MPNSILDSLPLGPLRRFDDFIVRAAGIGRPPKNTYRLVAKSDGLHVIKWDGTDVGPLAASGGGGGAALLGLCAYDPGSSVDITTTTTLTDLDATNAAVTFTAPASGNVLVRVTCQAYASTTTGSLQFGLREGSTTLYNAQVAGDVGVSSTPVETISRTFYLAGIAAGSHTYKVAVKHLTNSWHVRYGGGTGGLGAITIEVIAAP